MISSNFSILMAVYKNDDPVLFKHALDSVYLNTLQPKEFVIVADGPLNEDLLEAIEFFSHNQSLRIIQLPINAGLANALNVGLKTINTEYTIRADADDFNYPNRFQELIGKLEEGYDLVGSYVREIDKFGNFLSFREVPETTDQIKKYIKRRNPFNHMSVGFRTKVVRESGGYPNFHLREDYGLWATLISKGFLACNIKKFLVDASAGKEMFVRRGGVKSAYAEIDLQIHLVKKGLKNKFAALIDGCLRALIFLAPSFAREFIYLSFLRKNNKSNYL